MFEVAEALEIVLKEGSLPPSIEDIPIEESLNRVLAEDIVSLEPIPAFDASIKDGYAVVASAGSGPRQIKSATFAGDSVFRRNTSSNLF